MLKLSKLTFALLVAGTLVLTPALAFAGTPSVPEAGSTVSLLGLALAGLVFLRRKLR
jgi:hypothetical protein